jgi:XisI protein
MDTLNHWRSLLEKLLLEYAAILKPYGDVKTYLIVSQDRNHFLLMHEGWNDQKRVHGMIVHAEIRDSKIWIHYDGIEDGITDELVAAGVPKDHIVLAFHPPHVRPHTGYAVA